MTSYEELTPEQREQVNAAMDSIGDLLYDVGDTRLDAIREGISNLVLTCVYIARHLTKPPEKKEGEESGI